MVLNFKMNLSSFLLFKLDQQALQKYALSNQSSLQIPEFQDLQVLPAGYWYSSYGRNELFLNYY